MTRDEWLWLLRERLTAEVRSRKHPTSTLARRLQNVVAHVFDESSRELGALPDTDAAVIRAWAVEVTRAAGRHVAEVMGLGRPN